MNVLLVVSIVITIILILIIMFKFSSRETNIINLNSKSKDYDTIKKLFYNSLITDSTFENFRKEIAEKNIKIKELEEKLNKDTKIKKEENIKVMNESNDESLMNMINKIKMDKNIALKKKDTKIVELNENNEVINDEVEIKN